MEAHVPVDIRKSLKKMLPFLLQARTDNLNEADTILRLLKVFEGVLDYNGMTEISREAEMKGKFVDVVLKVDGVIRLLVEAKAAGETLRDRHIDQAQGYASKNNYRWVLLTNGVTWNLYHLTFGEGIEYERAFSVDLSNADDFDASARLLSLLHKSSIKKGELDDFWLKATALGPASIGKALFHETILGMIRREIRKQEGLLIDIEDLGDAIHKMLSPEARELMGPLKIRKKRAAKKPRAGVAPDAALAADGGAPEEDDSAGEPEEPKET